MKSVLAFWFFSLAYLLRLVFEPYIISGTSTFTSVAIMFGLFNGLFISFTGIIVSVRGYFRVKYLMMGFLAAILTQELHLMSNLVKLYEYVLVGHLPKPYEEYHVAKHNVYLVFLFISLCIALLFNKFRPNAARKLIIAPMLVLFMGCNFYHYYQFFLFTDQVWSESRDNALSYITKEITTDNFMPRCESVDKMICVEWKEGDQFPHEALLPASHILHEVKDAYESGNWDNFNLIYTGSTDHNGYNEYRDGQIDNTFEESFWSSINLFVHQDSGTYRLAIYDHMDMIHVGSATTGVALAIASMLWMSIVLTLLSFHPNKKPRNESKWLLAIVPICLISMLVLCLRPLHESYHYLGLIFAAFYIQAFYQSWRKLLLGAALIALHVMISYLMFAKGDTLYISGLIWLLSLKIGSLWLTQTKSQNTFSAISSKVNIVICLIIPSLFIYLKDTHLIHTHSTIIDLEYLSLGFVLISISVSTVLFLTEKSKRLVNGEIAIIYASSLIVGVISLVFLSFVNQYSYEFVNSLNDLIFNNGKIDYSHILVSISHYHALVVTTILTFLKLIHYYLRSRHKNHKIR
ncbi:TPA: hypothetical protein ACPVZG_000167 [Vibrio parahaemolyticus]